VAADQEALKQAVLANETVKSRLAGKRLKRVVAVPGKLVSIVVE